jgi:glycosyltransferase involved in cell wall biosynthesis
MEYPVITVCTVVRNREWIIRYMLESLLRQGYPKDRIFYVLVDGGSTDRTVSVAEELLRGSGIKYEVVVRESNIPEARNLCIDLAVGDVLVFWDSDVVAPTNSLEKLVSVIIDSDYGIVAADIQGLIFNDVDSAVRFINELLNSPHTEVVSDIVPIDVFVSMGFTAIKKEVFKTLRFDEDLTYNEDRDYCERAIKRGYKVGIASNVKVYDVDVKGITWSNIYSSMPLSYHLRGITKKARLELYPYKYDLSLKTLISHFIKYPSRALYLLYMFLMIYATYGVLSKSIIHILPLTVVLVANLLYQVIIMKRKLVISMKNIIKGLIFGIPYSVVLLYYMTKGLLRHYLKSMK